MGFKYAIDPGRAVTGRKPPSRIPPFAEIVAQLRSLEAEINGSSHGERAKPAELGLEERDIADAVKWARQLPATKTARKK